MLMTIGIVLLAVIVAFLAYVVTRPGTFHLQRSTTINTPPDAVFPLINDFHRWEAWSPWEKLDATMTKSYTGAPSGKGAVYDWAGNSKAGAGRMEITESTQPSLVIIDLHFLKPFNSRNVAEFTVEPTNGATRVTWAMHGPLAFVPKAMRVFMNIDDMIGKDFETGLANMKTLAER